MQELLNAVPVPFVVFYFYAVLVALVILVAWGMGQRGASIGKLAVCAAVVGLVLTGILTYGNLPYAP